MPGSGEAVGKPKVFGTAVVGTLVTGDTEGALVLLGLLDGARVGSFVALTKVGLLLGVAVGIADGMVLGTTLGRSLGRRDGDSVVGASVVGATVVGASVVGAFVVGASVVGLQYGGG